MGSIDINLGLGSTLWLRVSKSKKYHKLLSPRVGCGGVHPQGRAWAKMVLGPFAETKGPRRAWTTPPIF